MPDIHQDVAEINTLMADILRLGAEASQLSLFQFGRLMGLNNQIVEKRERYQGLVTRHLHDLLLKRTCSACSTTWLASPTDALRVTAERDAHVAAGRQHIRSDSALVRDATRLNSCSGCGRSEFTEVWVVNEGS